MTRTDLLALSLTDVTTRVTTLARLDAEDLLDVLDEALSDDRLRGLARLAQLELEDRCCC